MTLYFAYGSNLLAARLRARCPSARLIGIVQAGGFDIAFDKIGQDGSGKATLVPAEGQGVPGALFRLDEADMATLDQIEGVGRGYERRTLCLDGARAHAYIAPPAFRDPTLPPFDWYKGLVLAGARECGLPAPWIARLAALPAIPDADTMRPRRIEALALLAACPAEWQAC